MMNTLLIGLLAAAAALLLLAPLAAWLRARRSLGRPAPDTGAVDGGVRAERRVYFFHSSHCPHCRSMLPLVDRLRREYPGLIRIDIAAHPQLAGGFGITATPGFAAVEGGVIRAARLGPVDEGWLRPRLDSASHASHATHVADPSAPNQ